MGEFLAFTWSEADPQATADAEALTARVASLGIWRPGVHRPGLTIWRRGAPEPALQVLKNGVLVGRCLRRGAARPIAGCPPAAEVAPALAARRLSQEGWGAYVALWTGPQGGAVFRDPSGAVDCLTWTRGDVRVTTSDASGIAPWMLPSRTGLDWSVIAGWLVDPGTVATAVGLSGVQVVPPGCLFTSSEGGSRFELIWRPSAHVDDHDPATDPARGLVGAVDLAVEGLAAPHDRMIGELSGGLDSAIVAAAVAERGLADRVAVWLNYHGDRPEGDERAYARAVADHLGLEVTCVPKVPMPLTEADFAEMARGLRPGLAAVDPERDRDMAARLEALGATAMLSGQGGDVVFFQRPTALVGADELRRLGWAGVGPRRIGDLARFTHQSAWSVLAELRRHRRPRPPSSFRRPGLAASWLGEGGMGGDPWLADAEALPPAKRWQVTALFQHQAGFGASRRLAAGEVVQPLLSQPVMEYCLGLTPMQLTEGRRDRALARRAFARRLPTAIVERRSKGDLTAHYGRSIAMSLDVLRPLLLDGCLCDAGLLDRARLEAVLSPDQLILRPYNSEILIAAMIETWVRWWQGRVPDAPTALRPRR